MDITIYKNFITFKTELEALKYFTKTLALSCQKDRKNKYKYACGLMTKQTLTHPRK